MRRLYLFTFLSLTLFGLSLVVIWHDEFGLRPWKTYQNEYIESKRAVLENDYQEALADFNASGGQEKIKELEGKLEKAVAIFESPEIQKKYEELQKTHAELLENIEQQQSVLQGLRGKFLEIEYLYITHQDSVQNQQMQELQVKIDAAELRRQSLLSNDDDVKDALAELTSDIQEIKAQIESLKAPVNDKANILAKVDETPVEIKQIHIKDIDKADRCESCHIGIQDMESVSDEQPLSKHPASFIYLQHHEPSKFGCTFCHRGEGRATTSAEKAHGMDKHWTEPMYEGDMTQTGCLNCHGDIKGLRGAEYIQSSTGLFEKFGCYGCHKIQGYEGLREIGPVLTDVGTKNNYTWMVDWLLNPKSYFKHARMPNFFLSKEEAEQISDYLFSMSGTTRHDVDPWEYEYDNALVSKGKKLWSQARCNLCHTTFGRGGDHIKMYAPDLSKVGSKVNKEWLFNWIKDPKKYFPETKMPRFRFTDDEIHALVEYIVSEYLDDDFEAEYVEPEPIAAESIDKGKTLIQQFGCYGCHELKGMEEMVDVAPSLKQQGVTYLKDEDMGEKIGTELTSIGSKPVELLDFGKMKHAIPHDKLSYLKQKLRAPRSFRDDLRMPDFGLTEAEVNQLAAVLYGFTNEHVPARFMVPSKSELNRMAGVSDYKFSGDFAKLIEDVKCTNCHSIKGIGEDYAPDLTYAGSKLKESWIRSFLGSPDVIRPLIQQMPNLGLEKNTFSMPRFNLGEKGQLTDGNKSDIDIAMNYFQQELVSKDIPKSIPTLPEVTREQQVMLGEALYQNKGCKACHQIGPEGGAVGPNLSNVGNRLTEGFVFKYLEDPKRFKPDVIEPNYGLSERERIYLTQYLMSLKLSKN
jgi:mono/diheme cytochrome c family protein/cytochrome c551/c552